MRRHHATPGLAEGIFVVQEPLFSRFDKKLTNTKK
jgi:hypothetical protein